ncbi:MAG: hypothetical protein AAFX93_15170 [Verrucomicrobiota bacterium]
MSNSRYQYEPVSRTEWLITFFLVSIPVVGFILLMCWAFGSKTHPSVKSWAQAGLIVYAIFIAGALLLGLLFVPAAALATAHVAEIVQEETSSNSSEGTNERYTEIDEPGSAPTSKPKSQSVKTSSNEPRPKPKPTNPGQRPAVGDTTSMLIEKFGSPRSQLQMGDRLVLTYVEFRVVTVDGIVTEVKENDW